MNAAAPIISRISSMSSGAPATRGMRRASSSSTPRASAIPTSTPRMMVMIPSRAAHKNCSRTQTPKKRQIAAKTRRTFQRTLFGKAEFVPGFAPHPALRFAQGRPLPRERAQKYTGAVPAHLVFISLFLGLVSGRQMVELHADPAVKSIGILVGNQEVARLTQPPWRQEVDLGAELVPRELAAIGYDEKGEEIARATQVLNLPRPDRK